MRFRLFLGLVALAGAGTLVTWTGPASAEGGGTIKDLIVGRIGGSTGSSVGNYGTVGGISAYSIGTTSCNNGDTLLSWRDSGEEGDQHPVIAQNIYRLKDGRFEHIGLSWVKHGFCAADSTVCGSCDNASGCDWLGVGCSDTYGASLNGSHTYLGPRSEVNPVTGEFAWPHTSASGNSTIRGRIQVDINDVDPSLNKGAVYIGEGHYISPDDAQNEWRYNNGAWRLMEVGSFSGGMWQMDMTDSTNEQEHAVDAWAEMDRNVVLVDVDVENDGRFVLGYSVTDNGDGTWHYEYGLFNMNSHRSAGGFSVPVGAGAAVSNTGFHDVEYHSGEPYDGTDWVVASGTDAVAWSTDTFESNADANALRWSTLYNFRFDADTPPTAVDIEISLFRPGSPDTVTVAALGPSPGQTVDADVNNDGVVDVDDLTTVILNWGPCKGKPCLGDTDGDLDVDTNDLVNVILNWS